MIETQEFDWGTALVLSQTGAYLFEDARFGG